MMLLTASLWWVVSANPPAGTPVSLPKAESVITIGNLTELSGPLGFLKRASRHTALLTPSSWASSMANVLQVDVTDKAALERTGIDSAAWMTRSQRTGAVVSCFRVSDEAKLREAASERLNRLGELKSTLGEGVWQLTAVDALDRVLGALVVAKGTGCVAEATGASLKGVVPEVSRLLKGGASTNVSGAPKGAVQGRFSSKQATAQVAADALLNEATVNARFESLSLPAFAGAGPSPFGASIAPALATVKMRFQPAALSRWVKWFFASIPEGKRFEKAAVALAPLLTGNALLVVERTQVTGPLRTDRQQFFAVKFALLAEVMDAEKARQVADSLDKKEVPVPEGKLVAGVEGRTAFFSNDLKALQVALAGARPGPQPHSVEYSVDAKRLAQGLAQVPLLQVLQTPELAAVVGLNAELGPLLLHTTQVNGFVEQNTEGKQVAQLRWSLDDKD
jgi:hypothetical protein